MPRFRTVKVGQFPLRAILSAVAAAVSVTLVMALVQPVGADKDNRQREARREALKLALNPVIRDEFPQLAKFGRAVADNELNKAKKIAKDIADHPQRTKRQVKAVLTWGQQHGDEDDKGDDSHSKGFSIGGLGRLAVVNPVGGLIRPQINIGAFVCPILNAILQAFSGSPFFAFIAPILNQLLTAFGCNPPPPPTTTSTATTSTTTTSTTTTTTTTTIPSTTTSPPTTSPPTTSPPTTSSPTTSPPTTSSPTTSPPTTTCTSISPC